MAEYIKKKSKEITKTWLNWETKGSTWENPWRTDSSGSQVKYIDQKSEYQSQKYQSYSNFNKGNLKILYNWIRFLSNITFAFPDYTCIIHLSTYHLFNQTCPKRINTKNGYI